MIGEILTFCVLAGILAKVLSWLKHEDQDETVEGSSRKRR
jgi:hypothetical protein